MRPSDEQIRELHMLMESWAHRHGYGTKELLAFMSASMVGTMAIIGYDQEFVDATFDRMKRNFAKKLEEFQKLDEI